MSIRKVQKREAVGFSAADTLADDVLQAAASERLLHLDKKRSQSLNAGARAANWREAIRSVDFNKNICHFLQDVKRGKKRRAYFRDFDGSYYRVPVSAALNQDMETAYSIGTIRKRESNRRRGSSSRNGGAQSGALNSPTRLIYTSEENSQGNSEKIPEWKKKLSEYPFSAGEETVEETSQYDYSKPFAEQVDDWIDGKIPEGDTLIVSGTPEVFIGIGMPSLPVTINLSHVDYALNGTNDFDHEIGEALLKQLPEAIKKPVAIMTSKTKRSSSVVAMLEIRHNAKQVVVPVRITGFGYQNGIQIDSNAITSVYGKDYSIAKVLRDAIQEESNGKFRLYYLNEKKAAALLQGAKVLMPKMPATRGGGFIHSLTEANSPVKLKIKDVTESQQFKRWFGKSKVVNDDGTPKRVYHGTDKKFRVFRSKSGVYWFSESRDYAEAMAEERGGDRVEEVYLNIRNPYYAKLEPGKFSDPNYEKALIREAKKRGCDGLIIQNDTDNELEAETFYVAFKPNQIKSATDNVGTFSTETEDIYFSAGEETVEVPEYLTDIEKAPPGRRRRKKDT